MAEGFVDNSVGDFTFIDYDTIKTRDGQRLRIGGIAAPEVWNWTEEGVTLPQPGGELAASNAAALARDGGFTNIIYTGEEDNNDRPIVRLLNTEGVDFSDKSYSEGIIATDDFTDDRGRKLYRQGQTTRFINSARGIPEDLNDPWTWARNERFEQDRINIETLKKNNISILKPKAVDEAEWKQYQDAFGDFNPFKKGDVQYHTLGAKYDNTAISPMSTGWDSAVLSMKEGLRGVNAAFNDVMDDEGRWHLNEERALVFQNKQGELPTFIHRFGDIESISDVGNYLAGLTGQMSPYLLVIMGSAVGASLLTPAAVPILAVGALSITPMALIYAGQTYSEMEGSMDEKSAAAAYTAGIIMSTLDRLGLKGLMSAAQVLTKNSEKEIAKVLFQEEVKLGNKQITRESALEQVRRYLRGDAAALTKSLQGLVPLPLTKKLIAKQLAADASYGLSREGITELGQELTQYGTAVAFSEKEFDKDELYDRGANALVGGAIMGTMVSPVLATPQAIQQRRRLRQQFEIDKNQPKKRWVDTETGELIDSREISGESFLRSWYEKMKTISDNPKVNKNRIQTKEKEFIDYDKLKADEANKLKNKGIWEWIKDIPDNFAWRPMEYYWKLPMAKKVNKVMEAMIAYYSPTNQDTVGDWNLWTQEEMLKDTGRRTVDDAIVLGRRMHGLRNTAKNRNFIHSELVRIAREGAKNEDERQLIGQINDLVRFLKVDIMEKIAGQKVSDESFNAEILLNLNRPSKKAVKKAAAEFKKLLMEGPDKKTQAEADALYNNLMDAGEGLAWHEAKPALGIKDVNPASFPSIYGKAANDPFRIPGMEKFNGKDGMANLQDIVREVVRNALVIAKVGNKGDIIKTFLAGAARDAGTDWEPKVAANMISAVEIWMGNYNPIKSRKLRNLQANMSSFNLVTILGTGGPAQLPEPIAALLGRISKGQGGKTLVEDLRGMAAEMAKHYSTSNAEIFSRFWKGTGLKTTSSWTEARKRFTAGGRMGIQYGVLGQQGFRKEDIAASRLRAAVGMTFVTVSGIKIITDMSRLMAGYIGNDAIMHYLDVLDSFYEPNLQMTEKVKEAYDMLAETRMPPMEVLKLYKEFKRDIIEKNVEKNWDWGDPKSFKELEGIMVSSKSYQKLVRWLDKGRHQWVDNSLANPNPSSKSRVSHDPHLALLFQFRGFIITMFATVVPRLIKRAMSGNPNQDFNAIVIIAGLIAMGFLALLIRRGTTVANIVIMKPLN